MITGAFSGVKRLGRGVDHPPYLAPRLMKSRTIPLLPLWAFVACYRANFAFTFYHFSIIPEMLNNLLQFNVTPVLDKIQD
jgi:hypothetical protein